MRPRLLRLKPWLVRALIPPRMIGTYVLYTASGVPRYIGRSDTDIRRRLLRHSSEQSGDYFTFDIHNSPANAFDMECALFHALAPSLLNRIHPDRPNFHRTGCAFCRTTQRAARQTPIRERASRSALQPPDRQSEES